MNSDAQLLGTIETGKPGRAMMPLKGRLSDQDIRDVLVYADSVEAILPQV